MGTVRRQPHGDTPLEVALSAIAAQRRRLDELERWVKSPARLSGSATSIDGATVDTGESTSSTSFTDLATVGPEVTVDVGADGVALVMLSAQLRNDTAGVTTVLGVALSGANTVAATGARALRYESSNALDLAQATRTVLFTGLAAGPTTFTCKYAVTTGSSTGTFDFRQLAVLLP